MTMLIFALALVLIVMALGLRNLVRNNRYLIEHRALLAQELEETKAAYGDLCRSYNAVFGLLDGYSHRSGALGGIHKRIDEIREVTEAIREHRQELFEQVFGLVYWLHASDQFLCALRDTAMPEGSSPQHDEQRRFWRGTSRTDSRADSIYNEILAQLGRDPCPSLTGRQQPEQAT